jgi:hypothetical protein
MPFVGSLLFTLTVYGTVKDFYNFGTGKIAVIAEHDVSGIYQRGSGSRRTSPDLSTGLFHFWPQPSVSLLSGKQLGAKD